jgi:hypothetical protein
MGSRTNFELKDSRGSVWLYSHWGGDTKAQDLANALQKAEPRWTDHTYGMRIVISQLIGDDWGSELGYGISSWEAGEESYDPICVDFPSQTVTYQNVVYTFNHFVEEFAPVLLPTWTHHPF